VLRLWLFLVAFTCIIIRIKAKSRAVFLKLAVCAEKGHFLKLHPS
jgi:hypothetical protein